MLHHLESHVDLGQTRVISNVDNKHGPFTPPVLSACHAEDQECSTGSHSCLCVTMGLWLGSSTINTSSEIRCWPVPRTTLSAENQEVIPSLVAKAVTEQGLPIILKNC